MYVCGFRFFFTPLTGVLFTFPSRYLFTIGRQVVLSLGRWSSQLPPGLLGSQGTQGTGDCIQAFVYGGVTLCAAPSQKLPLAILHSYAGPTTPRQKPVEVWAIPRSLATTWGVSFDFLSCGY